MWFVGLGVGGGGPGFSSLAQKTVRCWAPIPIPLNTSRFTSLRVAAAGGGRVSGWPIRGSGPRWRGPAAGGAAKRSLALPASCVLGYDRWGDACPDPDATDVSVSGTMRVCDQHTVSPSVTRLRFSSKLPRLRAASKTRGKFLAGRPHRSSQCVPGFG